MLLTIFVFFGRNPLIPEDHAVNKVPQNMGFDESNHILFMCFMKHEKHVLLDIFEQQTENWYFHEKSPHKVTHLPLRYKRSFITPVDDLYTFGYTSSIT